ncbi:MAG: PspA-associated protein PspAA [Acidimicrobiales bacterium]
MIVRVLGEGQYELAEDQLAELDALDQELVKAVDTGDDQQFRTVLTTLVETVRKTGTAVPHDSMVPSDLVLPEPTSSLQEVAQLLSQDGTAPGPPAEG